MASYVKKIRTESGDLQIDYTALANLPQSDTTLTQRGKFADAQIVGSKITELNNKISTNATELENKISESIKEITPDSIGALPSTYTPPVKSVNGEIGDVEVTRIKGNDNSYAKVDYSVGYGTFVTTVSKDNVLVSFRVKEDGKIPQVRYQDGSSITADNIYTQTWNPPKIGVVGAKEGHVAVFDSSGNIVSSGKSFWDFTRAKMTLSGTTLTITTVD